MSNLFIVVLLGEKTVGVATLRKVNRHMNSVGSIYKDKS